ncbi:MAG: hypothetical protein RSD27_10270 [Ruthenibacterium sp.]
MIDKSKDEQREAVACKSRCLPLLIFFKKPKPTQKPFSPLLSFPFPPTVPAAQFECARLFAVKFFPAAEYLP